MRSRSPDGHSAIIAYCGDGVAAAYSKMGVAKLAAMTDEQVLEFLERRHRPSRRLHGGAAEHGFVAVEVPMADSSSSMTRSCDLWPGHVVTRVVLGGDGDGIKDEFVSVDGKDLTIREFVRMMSTFGGWGFRLVFVADTPIHDTPQSEVWEPS